MDRLPEAAILSHLAARLRDNGSWCGETHLQKAVYLLQELLGLPTDFPFVLYLHGPFSFDLRDELTSLRADGLLEMEVQAPPYGPRLRPTERAVRLERAFAPTVKTYERQIEFVAQTLGRRTIYDVERLATALFVTKRCGKEHDGSVHSRAECIHRLKPHVPVSAAAEAVEEIDRLSAQIQAGNKA